ncbi:MAG: H/ACA RNA-protein complex protein Gar1 [Thermoprotei archaeon]|nr:MAG: H/ACA RNA-protein complex protein Gar1 [Thermoprotei archaeon]
MLVIGKVIRVTRDGKLVVKAKTLPKLGAEVYDSAASLVGFVYDIIGPVSSPYVVVKVTSPRIRRPDYLVNRLLYAMEVVRRRRRGGRR